MSDTPVSLLERIRCRPDGQAWRRLVDLYTPLIRGWLRRHFLPDADADDLVQEILAVVVRELPHFEHCGRPGAFRGWLRAVTAHRLRDFWRGRRHRPAATGASDFLQKLEQLEDPGSGLSGLWDEEHDRHVVRRLLDAIRPDFRPSTWQAFEAVMLRGEPPEEVAGRLGISVNAVLLAKSRVLARLRAAGEGLIG
jgi:RNA polymerase sigma-70 factor, ECF subfamily